MYYLHHKQLGSEPNTVAPILKSKLSNYPFISRALDGRILFVGEGNLSFSLSIAGSIGRFYSDIVATTYEKPAALSIDAKRNAYALQKSGASVFHDIDCTKLDQIFPDVGFDTIVFQFPNVGSRQPKYGRNPNHHLLTRFLRSSHGCLNPDGEVAITIVNRPHYEGAFDVDNAAQKSEFDYPEEFKFEPKRFSGYSHVNTNDENESALSRFRSFRTWVFRSRI